MSLYQHIFNASPDAMLLVNPYRDQVLNANQRFLSMCGLSKATMPVLSVGELFSQDLERFLIFTQEVMEMGEAWSDSICLRVNSEETINCEVAGSRLDSDEQNIVLTLRDNLQLKKYWQKAEAQAWHREGLNGWRTIESIFREFERENQLILHAAGEGIYGVDANGLTTFVNPAAERMLGWSADDLIGKDIHKTIHHSHEDGSQYHGCDCHIHASFKDGRVRHIDHEVFWRKDGKSIPVEYTSTPILDEGRPVGAVVIFRDISERRQAEARLHAALEEVQTLKLRLEMENAYLQEEYRAEHNYKEIVGNSTAVHRTLKQVEVVAPTDANVLIYGESGTGKELIARAIHDNSDRHDRPLIRVNCASIPRELFESEFFGHVKGAFTGATGDRAGRFELADGGTLFLDEVGEIPLELQGKLLRVLQEQQFERVGESKTRRVDVRIIAATNRDLKKEVVEKRFREDLYFRLNVFPVELAPLRDRIEDVPLLACHFLEKACKKIGKPDLQFTVGQIQQLQNYNWPGNVRELVNLIERSVILSSHGQLHLSLPQSPVIEDSFSVRHNDKTVPVRMITEHDRRRMEKDSIIMALKRCNGKVFGDNGAAAILGIKPTTLSSRIKRYNINRYEYK